MRMSLSKSLAIAIMAACVGIADAGMATAKDMGTYGGNGGGEFRSECRPGHVLVGVKVRAGTAMDAIAAYCVRTRRGRWIGEPSTPTQMWGGPGGGPRNVLCNRGDYVGQMKISAGPWGDIAVVKYVSLECYSLTDPDYHYRVVQHNPQGTVEGSSWKTCPENYVGSGIYGKSGNLVDRLGLSCRK